MPGANERNDVPKLANELDQDYTRRALEAFFGQFRGLRWDRITITDLDNSGIYASGTSFNGGAVTCVCQIAIPAIGDEWWAMKGRDGVWYLDDIAR